MSGIIGQDGALAEKLGTGLQNLLDGSVTRTCLHFTRGAYPSVCFGNTALFPLKRLTPRSIAAISVLVRQAIPETLAAKSARDR